MGLVEASAIVIEDVDITFETDKVGAALGGLWRPGVRTVVCGVALLSFSPADSFSFNAGILACAGGAGGKDQAACHCHSE